MLVLDRVITRNAMLCDGTPRCEKGYRPHLTVQNGLKKQVWIGPLLESEADAEAWFPTEKEETSNG